MRALRRSTLRLGARAGARCGACGSRCKSSRLRAACAGGAGGAPPAPATPRAEEAPLGVRFSPGAFLFPYYCGVLSALRAEGVVTDATPLAGASAGAIVAVCAAAGLSPARMIALCEGVYAETLRRGVVGAVEGVLREALHRELPEDAHLRASGRVAVGVTRLFPPQREAISQFESREDLIDVVVASSFIPIYLAPALATPLRGRAHVDGYFSAFLPELPVPCKETVDVTCFPPLAAALLRPADALFAESPGRHDIQPGVAELLAPRGGAPGSAPSGMSTGASADGRMSSLVYSFSTALIPNAQEIGPMAEAGERDARAWAAQRQ